MKKELLGVFALFIVALLLAGCVIPPIGGEKDITALIPAKADSVAVIDWKQIMDDKDIWESMPQSSVDDFETSLQEMEKETGIDMTKIEKIAVFGDMSAYMSLYSASAYGSANSANTPMAGVILQGTFDSAKIKEAITEQDNTESKTYNGQTIYYSESGGTDSAVGIIGDSYIIIGTMETVEEVIDVESGKAKAIDADFIGKYSGKVDTSGWIVAVITVPADAKASLKSSPSSAGSPIDSKLFANVDEVALSYSKSGSNMDVKISLYCSNENSATKIGDALDGILKLAKGTLEEGTATEALVSKLALKTDGRFVSASLTTTQKELEEVQAEMNAAQSSGYNSQPSYSDDSYYG
ncbi:MAG: hypothetical protein ABIH99_05735 [Candidatus Micrarchaeota archaeon]